MGNRDQKIKSSWYARATSFAEKVQAKKYARKTKKALHIVFKGAGNEVKETREMADSFFRLLSSKLNLKNRKTPPTEEEVKAAIEQLKDIGRISVFATISLLPGGGFSLIGLELLARKYGITGFTFIPSSFRKEGKKAESDSKAGINPDLPDKT